MPVDDEIAIVQRVEDEPRAKRVPSRRGRWPEALATAACTGFVIVAPKSLTPAIRVAFVLMATAGAIDLSRREARDPGSPLPIACAIAALFGLAVATPPKFATDIWSYTLTGRILAVHHLNPYRVAPVKMASDPLLPLLHHTWRSGTTPYGPVAVLHAASVALIAGTHPLLYRLAFQSSAAAAIGAALYLLWRTTRSTAALALVGLHPEVVGSIVNGGHNDAVIALGLLVIVLLLARGRMGTAGWVFLATVLTKLTLAYATIPIAVWIWHRHGRRALLRFLLPSIVAVPLVAVIPGAVKSMTQANGGVVTRLAIWNVPIHVGWFTFAGLHASNYSSIGLVAVAVLISIAAWRERDQLSPARGAAFGVAAWVGLAAYVVPWYTVTGLVVAALRPTGRLARWLAVQGGIITAAFLIPRSALTNSSIVGAAVHLYIPLALTATLAWVVFERRDRRKVHEPML